MPTGFGGPHPSLLCSLRALNVLAGDLGVAIHRPFALAWIFTGVETAMRVQDMSFVGKVKKNTCQGAKP